MHDIIIVCIFVFSACFLGILGGVIVGGWLHHRGVLAGRGVNDNFIGEPKGEVFRIPMPGDMDDEEEPEAKHLEKIMGRVKAFTGSLGGTV